MTKIRVLIFLTTILIVGLLATYISLYARGYRFSLKTLKFAPSGILVIKSDPDGASVIINGELKTATNTTFSLPPGTYDIEVKKEGFFPWAKRLTIEKEVVTQANISLFKSVPSLSPVTFVGATNPIMSDDSSKIAYVVTPAKDIEPEKIGLWVMDTFNLPIGFSKEPRRVTDGDLSEATYQFSPDGRQILLTTENGVFLIESGSFTPQAQRVNLASRKDQILVGWEKERKSKLSGLLKALPPEVAEILERKTSSFTFSPDETMVLYAASSDTILPENLTKPLPGASTQKQERAIKAGQTYIYDIKEDRNFLITDRGDVTLRWFPTSRHIIMAEEGKITIMDYDGTNRQVVYSGSYISPHAYPSANTSKLLIPTNLGADSSTPNLYSLTIK